MTSAEPQTTLVKRIVLSAGVFVLWLILIAYLHHAIHIYKQDIALLIPLPFIRSAITVLMVGGIIYAVLASIPILPKASFKVTFFIFFWVGLIVGGHSLVHLGGERSQDLMNSLNDYLGPGAMILIVILYALILAMPFVAGIELGILLMFAFGETGVILAYLSTVLGLNIAFAAGRYLPESIPTGLMKKGGSEPPHSFDDIIAKTAQRTDLTGRIIRFLSKHRLFSLAVLLNFPGNTIIGGGGGISLICGLSKQMKWIYFLCTVMLATLPLPLLVLLGLFKLDAHMEHSGILHDILLFIPNLLSPLF